MFVVLSVCLFMGWVLMWQVPHPFTYYTVPPTPDCWQVSSWPSTERPSCLGCNFTLWHSSSRNRFITLLQCMSAYIFRWKLLCAGSVRQVNPYHHLVKRASINRWTCIETKPTSKCCAVWTTEINWISFWNVKIDKKQEFSFSLIYNENLKFWF